MYNAVVAGMAFVQITMKDSELRKGLARSQKKIESFADTAKRTLAELNLASTGAFTAFMGITSPIYMAISAFTKFDDKIRTLKAISGGSASAISGLERYIRKQGATTAFTADQVADGTVELSRMGFEVNELQAAIRPVMDLVRATGEDTYRLGEVSDYAASVLRIFNLRADKFGDVCDVMGFAANKSAAGISDMGEAFKIAGPSAAAVNEDIRDTAAALMVMANAGIKGSLAGTSLRKIYQSIAVQSGQMNGLSQEEIEAGMRGSKALNGLGIQIVDPNTGNLRKAADIMVDLARAVSKMKSGEKINFATDVFDLRGSLGALTMLSASGSQVKQFRAEMQNISGYVNTLAAEMESGPGGKMRKMFSALKDSVIELGKAMFETFSPTIEILTRLAKGFSDLAVVSRPIVSLLSNVSFHLLALGAAFKSFFAIGAGIKSMFSPLFKVTGYVDLYASGAKEAVRAAEERNNQLKHVEAIREKDAALFNARKNAVEKASAALEKKNALNSARSTLGIEKQKLEELQKLQSKQNLVNILKKNLYSSVASERVSDAQLSAVQQELSAQEKAVERSAKKMEAVRNRFSSAQSAVDSLRVVEQDEKKKLEAVRKRFAEQDALNEKWRLQHTLSGSKKKFQELPEYTNVKKEIQAQERAVASAIAKREALEKRRHLSELKNATTEAEAVLASEQKKLAAIKSRYNQVVAIRQKHAAMGVVGEFHSSPELDATKKEIQAQERVVRRHERAVAKYSEEYEAAIFKEHQANTALVNADNNFKNVSKSVFAAGKMRVFHTNAVKKSLFVIGQSTGALKNQASSFLASMRASNKHAMVLANSSVQQLQAAGASKKLAKALIRGANAKLAFDKAMAVISANPFTFALTGALLLSAGLDKLIQQFTSIKRQEKLDLSLANREANYNYFVNLKEENKENYSKFERLKQLADLSAVMKLSSEEVSESVEIINKLEPFGSKNWSQIDVIRGRLKLLGNAFDDFTNGMTEESKKQLLAQLAGLNETKKQLEEDLSAPKSFWYWGTKTGVQIAEKASVELPRTLSMIDEVKKALRSLSSEKKDFLSGFSGDNVSGKPQTVADRLRVGAEEVQKAKDAVAKIEEENMSFRQSELENQIQKIKKLRAEYVKYMQTLIAAEKAKSVPDKNVIKSYYDRIAQANLDFNDQEKEVRDKATASIQETEGAFDKIRKEDRFSQSKKAVADWIQGFMSKGDFAKAASEAGRYMNDAWMKFLKIEKAYLESFRLATADYGDRGSEISFSEKQDLDAKKKSGEEMFALYREYRDRLREAQRAGADALSKASPGSLGDWSARALQQMLGGKSVQERTAKASEETAKNTRRILRLKDGTTISFS